MAQEELANLFSCLKAELDSPRQEFLADCATEYRLSVTRKVDLATQLANSMVHILHGLRLPTGSPTVR